MPRGRPPPVKKRELTVFDLPSIGTPTFPTHIRKPSVTVFHRQRLNDNNAPKTRVNAHKAQLRLRELTASNIGQTRTLTDSELDNIASDYLANRSKSTDSWFHQRHRNPKIHRGKLRFQDASTQLCLLPPITSQGAPILRRPTVLQPKSIPEGGDFFKVILKNKEFMPFSFRDNLKMSIEFYASHYPLLMRKMPDNSLSSRRRVSFVTEEMVRETVRVSSAEKRAIKMEEKMAELEHRLKRLEEEDDEIVTELRHDIFNPLKWSYSKDKS